MLLRIGRALVALLLVVSFTASVLAAGAPINEATDDQKKLAQLAFLEGRVAFDARRFVDALRHFRKSHDIVASPNSRLLIANTLMELRRPTDAYGELLLAVEEADAAAAADERYKEAAEIARADLADMRQKIGLLTVNVSGADDAAKLSVAGKDVPRERWGQALTVEPGNVAVVLKGAAGNEVQEVSVDAGGDVSVSIAPPTKDEPPPPPPVEEESFFELGTSTQHILAYAAAGLGAAGLVVGGVMGGLALSTRDDLVAQCGEAPCPQRTDDIDKGEGFQLGANISFIAGGALLATGVVLFFTAPSDEDDDEAAVSVSLGPGHINLRGRF
jgi:hypothetical protein